MEIINRKSNFPNLLEISVLGQSISSLYFEQGSSWVFFSAVSFFLTILYNPSRIRFPCHWFIQETKLESN
jgi:hypothetical protein